MEKIKLGITHGDYNGVGYEVTLKALADELILELFTPVFFADWRIVDHAVRTLGLELPPLQRVRSAADAKDGKINIVDLQLQGATVEPGVPNAASGAAAVKALDAAVKAVKSGDIDAIVTAPISKEAVQSDNFHFSGHTEYLEAQSGDDSKAQMILYAGGLRVALVTTHLPIADVAAAITKERVYDSIMSFNGTLRQDFSITRPKIAVLSLNPHCGDGGVLGHEDEEIIKPAIEEAQKNGVLALGPYPADGFFGSGQYTKFDGVLAMYHDQGLAPFKALAGSSGVNFTAGLPFVRTSPDHGTACDIAWKGEADPVSMREAMYQAVDIVRCREIDKQINANPLECTHHADENKERPQRERKIKDTGVPKAPYSSNPQER